MHYIQPSRAEAWAFFSVGVNNPSPEMAKKTLKYKLDTAEIFTFVLYYKHGQGYSVYVITMEIVRIYILPITNQMKPSK